MLALNNQKHCLRLIAHLMSISLTAVFLVVCLTASSSVAAKTWASAIEEAESQSELLWEEARKRGALPLGTAFNEYGIAENKCAILGRILDRGEFITKLEYHDIENPKSKMSEGEILNMQIDAVWLANWAHTAKHLLKLSVHEQISIWNLDCVGSFEIPESARIEETNPTAKFRIDGTTLYVLGDIESGFAESLAAIVASNPTINTIALGSAGGSVYDALKAGQMIRALGINTTLANNCYSACPLVFLGGVSRIIWSPYPKLGFHQMYMRNGRAVQPIAPEYDVIREYVRAMGVNERFVIAAMFAAQPNDMFTPDMLALCDNNVATGVQRLCISKH